MGTAFMNVAMNRQAKTKVCCIIGSPVAQSLSPLFHNAGYKAKGLDFVYVAFDVGAGSGSRALEGIRALGIRGASVTMPLKIEVLGALDEVDFLAQQVGAVNTVVNEGGILKGYNTDCFGVVDPLRKRLSLKSRRVAILGAGGAARAAACAVNAEGGQVSLFVRNAEKGSALANSLGCELFLLSDDDALRECSVIVNATPLGMIENPGMPVSKEALRHRPLVFDMIYKPRETELLREAVSLGCEAIGGIEMLIAQALEQFRLFTGEVLSEDIFRKCMSEMESSGMSR
jgi:shikimate dehydrogenase